MSSPVDPHVRTHTPEQLLMAATFAGAGEPPPAGKTAQKRRTVLLVLRALEPAPEVLAAALSMMDRLEAGVEILLRAAVRPPSVTLGVFLEEVASHGKESHLTCLPELSWEAVVGHAESVTEIVCIMVESLETWGLKSDPESRRPPVWSNRLPCPLVVAALGSGG
ncbi:MAG: hypothetical protein HQM02_03520 [Magnetococcales bacterium]|nr:hypothetical protein [Magnetococcales bacterium]